MKVLCCFRLDLEKGEIAQMVELVMDQGTEFAMAQTQILLLSGDGIPATQMAA